MGRSMKALVIKHLENEGAGTLDNFLRQNNIDLEIVELYKNQDIPSSHKEFSAIIIMGGTMNVDDHEHFPFLEKEKKFVRKAIDSGIPVLGVCLGAQIIARCYGGDVVANDCPQAGWSTVQLTDSGRDNRIFKGISKELIVFQWHNDTFHIPVNAFHIAVSKDCPYQAFNINNAYAFQFHIEADREIISEWFRDSKDLPEYLGFYDRNQETLKYTATMIYTNFLEIINEYNTL